MSTISPSRRRLFAVVPALALAAPSFTAARAPEREPLALAKVEAAAIRAELAQIDDASSSDARWDAWEARHTAFLKWAESLPVTADNAPIKALAVALIYSPEGIDDFGDDTTDVRLVRQIIKGLVL